MFNERLIEDVRNLLREFRVNLHIYINNGILNSEGRKLRMLIIKKLIILFPERRQQIREFRNMVDEEDVIKFLTYVSELIDKEKRKV